MDSIEITNHATERTSTDQDKTLRLVEFLKKLTGLRTTVERDLEGYKRVLWLHDIPNEKDCFTQAWGPNQDFDEDVWIQIRSSDEPKIPSIPEQCREWADLSSLGVKTMPPQLRDTIYRDIPNPEWGLIEQKELSDEPEYIQETFELVDNPQIQQMWQNYIESEWVNWVNRHDRWDRVHQFYKKLFTIRQDIIRLGEEYELVIGVGVLSWHPKNGQLIRRHLTVANVELVFDAEHKEFIVRPATDGADLRPELDMLDSGHLQGLSESQVKSDLSPAADNPWDKSTIEAALSALTNTLSADSQFTDTLEQPAIPSSEPHCTFSPALILRKRSAHSLAAVLQHIDESIRSGVSLPAGFMDLAENSTSVQSSPGELPAGTGTVEWDDQEIYFPKPANNEQRKIVEQVRRGSGVLVQGPPGTGKSHTIANLISHFLATGKRVLITAKTPRALQVLQNKLPEELRPLCINLLGQGQDERHAMESSVTRILEQQRDWDQSASDSNAEALRRQLKELRQEKTINVRRLQTLRESECCEQSVAGGTYKGTAATISKLVNKRRAQFSWLKDEVPLEGDCPLDSNVLHRTLQGLRSDIQEKREILNQTLPDELLGACEFKKLVTDESNAKATAVRLKASPGYDKAVFFQSMLEDELARYAASVQELEEIHKRLNKASYIKESTLKNDLERGQVSQWQQRHEQSTQILKIIKPLAVSADYAGINLRNRSTRRTPDEALNSILHIERYLQDGGQLGWSLFLDKQTKKHRWVLKELFLKNDKIDTPEQVSIAVQALTVAVKSKNLLMLWGLNAPDFPKDFANIVQVIGESNDIVGDAIKSSNIRKELSEIAKRYPGVEVPDVWNADSLVRACP